MTKTGLATAALLLLSAIQAGAQTAPFDMSSEKPKSAAPAAASTKPPVQAAPAQGGAASDTGVAPAPVASGPADVRRYIIPFSDFVLSGETAHRSWAMYLTPEQAASHASLKLAYQNAIVVAPEMSRLRLSINGSQLLDTPIAAPDNPKFVNVDVPAGLLHPGLNEISIGADQRHRTDCTVPSTYELWTQIDTTKTYLSFDGASAGTWKRFEDLRAIGVDANGATTFNVIAPSLEQSVATQPMIRLAEALGIMANMPNQSFDLSETAAVQPRPGQATVVIGPAAEISTVLASLPAGAETMPVSAVVNDAKTGPSTLVVTGPDWSAVNAAVNEIARQFDRPDNSQRTSLSTQTWHTPDVPLITGASQVKLSDLGVSTQEFSGRRLRTDFTIGVPSDFYADAYGQMTLLLDAAYSQEVLPGSHIDIYVNDNIAATVPITTSGGEILRHLPIKVAMRHLRPGTNVISIEAILMTQADAVCAPGTPASKNKRFVLFDSSELAVPDFARVGRTPNLAAVSGTGFPYNRSGYSTPLIVDRSQPEALSAAATLLARMSVAAGRPVRVDTTTQEAAVADRNAIFVGAISQVAPAVLAQVGIANDNRSTWGETVASINPDTDTTFDEWRQKLRGGGWRGQVSGFEDWMNRTFNLSSNSFHIIPGPDPMFTPQGSASLVVAQQANPIGTGAWTLVTAPTASLLRDGVRSLVQQDVWRQMGGHVTTVDAADDKVVTVPVSRFAFSVTQPFSLWNSRLIIANWLSANVLSYSLLLTLLSILLGLATAGLLGSLGRRQ